MNTGRMLILSGPSGSGKSTLTAALKQEFPDLYFSISTTTRAPRAGEAHGREYFFTTQEAFLQDIESDRFLEWAQVHHNYYGTSRTPIEQALQEGKLVLFDVDVQGHRNIKKHYPQIAKSIFITTPTDLILRQRLTARNTDTQEVIESRIQHAYDEMLCADEFDFLIINDDIQKATKQILSIAHSLACSSFDAKSLSARWRS